MAGRRGNNEGSIYRRADGQWAAAVSLPGIRRRVVYGRTRLEVSQKLTTLMAKLQGGQLPAPTRLTVAAYLQQWLDAVKPSLRPKTYVSYEGVVRLRLVPLLGTASLQRLTAPQVGAALTRGLERGMSANSIRYALIVLRIALHRAEKWGLVSRNVASDVDPPKVERPRFRALDPEEARQLLEAASGDRLEALYTVALSLGLRLGETLGLRWHDVDLEAGTLRVENSLQRHSGALHLVATKTDRSRRTLAMPELLVESLRRHRQAQLEEELAAPVWFKTGHVFTTEVGTPIDPSNARRSFVALLVKAKLPHVRFHDLRHSAASLLLAQGAPPRVVMETLGHSRIAVTMDTYSHVTPELQREAARAMDRALRPTATPDA